MLSQANQIFQYNGSPITFQKGDSVMVNATQMAKPFKKEPKFWLSNQSTTDYLTELSKVRNLTLTDLVQVTKGGNNSGTWMHEDVALEFARWLSPSFAVWCNDRIKELLTQGVATITNDDEAILHAMQVLQQRVEASKQQIQVLEGEKAIIAEANRILQPKAEYADTVLQSTSTFTTTQIAQGLDMSANALNRALRELGIQYRQSGQWTLTAKVKGRGYAKNRVHSYFNQRTETIETSQILVWTEKGRQFIHQLRSEGKL